MYKFTVFIDYYSDTGTINMAINPGIPVSKIHRLPGNFSFFLLTRKKNNKARIAFRIKACQVAK